MNQFPMSRNNDPLDQKPETLRRQRPWGTLGAVGLTLLIIAIWRSPPYSFHPICTYTVNANVTADVEMGGQKLSSTVVYQNSRSRQWISMINSAGCKQWYGNALTYKLADDRVLVVPTRICHKGEKMLAASGRVDVLSVCTGKQAHQDSAFMVDSATHPQKWYAVTNGIEFRIDSMTAVSTWSTPSDDMASIAPNLLKSDFKYQRQQWSRSPERIIPFQRRYNERRHKPDQAYEFDVNDGGPLVD
ncbi:MAG: hypothetical protein ACRCS9_06855 [Hyphomicrobium sp.]